MNQPNFRYSDYIKLNRIKGIHCYISVNDPGILFSRYDPDPKETGPVSVAWKPRSTDYKAIVNALTCNKEELPPLAVEEPDVNDYTFVHCKFLGMVKVPTIKYFVREIAIARLAGII